MKTPDVRAQAQSSFLDGGNSAYLETIYEQYLADPNSVDASWRDCFAKMPASNGQIEPSHQAIRDKFLAFAQHAQVVAPIAQHQQVEVLNLVNAYRSSGHQKANLDPLQLNPVAEIDELTLEYHGLGQSDLDTEFDTGFTQGPQRATLREIIEHCQKIYCGNIGAEIMHMTDATERQWFLQALEGGQERFSPQFKKRILERLVAADGLERHLHTKYVGQKRFALEGSDALIPLMDELILQAGANGVKEIVIGMAHRGRLNVLVNIMGKFPSELFAEFEGKKSHPGMGDVKYHQGFSADAKTDGGYVHLALAFNPSHLEIVAPVVEGSVRARQARRNDHKRDQVLPLVLHGDSAFTGQGVVMETFNMSQARGYCTGGTVHVVVNNQVGFTTSNPQDTRSSLYCTDVAKMVHAPILHVNGDDPEAVLWATHMALDYRMKFHKDVVIDLISYRRHGHNEADEPMATQPLMYQKIKQHPVARKIYADKLIAEKLITADEADAMVADYRKRLEKGEQVTATRHDNLTNEFAVNWQPYLNKDWTEKSTTNVPLKKLKEYGKKLYQLPDDFVLQAQVKKMWQTRSEMVVGKQPLDWGCAETLAYASLLAEGSPVRISGQDSCRGTFAHRHAVVHCQKTGKLYTPLAQFEPKQDAFTIIDSVLSEEAVLAFEYGHSVAEPETLVIWEAQFGDFVNGAQVVIDQFITSGEQKWERLSGVAMFLPHGYEGQGAEHSSARLERFLQLSAQHNIQVCVPTTPAQAFHMIRRQMRRQFRKPLIVMTPKSLLRHKLATSSLDELVNGHFNNVIGEIDDLDPKQVTRLVLCSGKVYYDLLEARRKQKLNHVAIVRVEQLYPFPEPEFKDIIASYKHVTDVIWCQEEPKNQGVWYSSQHHIHACLSAKQSLHYAGRDHAAAPAVGSPALHAKEQAQLVKDALES